MALLAGGKAVKVTIAGKGYDIPVPAPESPIIEPHPLVEPIQQLIEQQAALHDAIIRDSACINGQMDIVVAALEANAGLPQQMAAHIGDVIKTLQQPIAPIHDAKGRIIGAQRKAL